MTTKESESHFLKIYQKLSWLDFIVKGLNGTFHVIEVKQSEDEQPDIIETKFMISDSDG
jgi:hypothetical protein